MTTPVSLKFTSAIIPFADGVWWKAKMFLFWLVLFIKRRVGIESRPEWFFKCAFKGKAFIVYLAEETDVQTFASIFGEEEYAIALKDEPKVILDLGSNIGLSLIYFSLLHPSARIFGFEPNPNAFGSLKDNTQAFSNISTFNIGVAGKDGTINLYTNKKKSTASSIRDRGGDTIESVPVLALGSILMRNSIKKVDLLKFDVEGAEDEIFASPINLDHIDNIVGEVHTDLMTVTRKDFLARFSSYELNLLEKSSGRFILKAKRI